MRRKYIYYTLCILLKKNRLKKKKITRKCRKWRNVSIETVLFDHIGNPLYLVARNHIKDIAEYKKK